MTDLRVVGEHDRDEDFQDDDDEGMPAHDLATLDPKLRRAVAAATAQYRPGVLPSQRLIPKPGPPAPPQPAANETVRPQAAQPEPDPAPTKPRIRRASLTPSTTPKPPTKKAPRKAAQPPPEPVKVVKAPEVPEEAHWTMEQALTVLYGPGTCNDGGAWIEELDAQDNFWWVEIGCNHSTWCGISTTLTDPGVAIQRAMRRFRDTHELIARGLWLRPVVAVQSDDT